MSVFLALELTLLAPAPGVQADPVDDAIGSIVDSLAVDAGPATGLASGDDAALGFPNGPIGNIDEFISDAYSKLYDAIHTAGEQWIGSDIGGKVDDAINKPFAELLGRDLIGNGVQGAVENVSLFGSSGAFGDLHDGGFLFGDGGSGVAGAPEHGCSPIFCGLFATTGGDAGLIGNGGAGGSIDSGGADSPGGEFVAATGFNGGNGGILMGNGGAGGQGGAGLGATDLAGLVGGTGGDGGNGGFLFGDGGTGGDGGDGAVGANSAVGAGGLGGAGGRAGPLVGVGGNGGDGGDGGVGGLGGPGGAGGLFGANGLTGATGDGGGGGHG